MHAGRVRKALGCKGGNATGVGQKNGGSVYSLPPFFGVGVSFV